MQYAHLFAGPLDGATCNWPNQALVLSIKDEEYVYSAEWSRHLGKETFVYEHFKGMPPSEKEVSK